MVGAILLVAARSAGAVMPGSLGIWLGGLWPGPAMPYQWTVLGLAAAIAVLCLTVALWRPCTAWGAEILRPLRVPAPTGVDASHVPPDGPGAG